MSDGVSKYLKLEKANRGKCRCCGGYYDVRKARNGVVTCESCGTVYTIFREEVRSNTRKCIVAAYKLMDRYLFDEAYIACKRAAEYDGLEPEAYFGMALAEFKVRYSLNNNGGRPRLRPVSFEGTGRKFSECFNYKQALSRATPEQRAVYERMAREIDAVLSKRTEEEIPAQPEEKSSETFEILEYLSEIEPEDKSGPALSITNRVLKRVNSKDEEITVPDGVTAIGDGAFKDCRNLKKVHIPDTVTKIGKNAFDFCCMLTDIVIPPSVTAIGFRAFVDCNSLTSITLPFIGSKTDNLGSMRFNYIFGGADEFTNPYVPLSLKKVTVTGGETVGDFAFFNCFKLTEINLPESVTVIGNYAFNGCKGVKMMPLPEAVKTIGNYAFYGCRRLKELVLGKNVETIGIGAFGGCDGLLEMVIPDSVAALYNETFLGCARLENVTLPEGLISIGTRAFGDCIRLDGIKIPSTVKYIGEGAFGGCESLKRIDIPDGVTTLATGMFAGCKNLESITIPKSVTHIGDDVFAECEKLTIYCENDVKPEGWDKNFSVYRDGKPLIKKRCKVVWNYKNAEEQ